jgi:hypothetical protein
VKERKRSQLAERRAQDAIRASDAAKLCVDDLSARLRSLEHNLATTDTFGQADREKIDRLYYAVLDPSGTISRLEHELEVVVGKVNSGGAIDFHGFIFTGEKDCVSWPK